MSKKIIYLLLAVSLGLNAGIIAMTLIDRMTSEDHVPPPGPGGRVERGRGGPPDPGKMVEDHLAGMTRHLGLDAEQQEAIREVMNRYAPQQAVCQREVEETGRRLAEAFASPGFDPAQFKQLTAEASAARSRLDSLSAEMLVAEAALLTPEQRLKYAEVAASVHMSPKRPPREGGPPPRR